MSKSDLEHELLQDQLITDEEILTQKSNEVILKKNRNRDSVIPFAEDMVDTVVTGALNVLDANRREDKPDLEKENPENCRNEKAPSSGKIWKDVSAGNKISSNILSNQDPSVVGGTVDSLQRTQTSSVLSADNQQPIVQVMHLRVGDEMVCDTGINAEQVAKIVKGLQDIQIGDSAYVLPADGSNIEKQVKRAVQNINSLEFGDMETAQLIICDGQGDVDAKVIETEVGPPSNAKPQQQEASKIPTGFLHKMIEELEDENGAKDNLPDHRNKESIASWEESEEKFIRIIEGPGDEENSVTAENQEHNDSIILDQASLPLGQNSDTENRNFENSLGYYCHQGFIDEQIIASQGEDNHSRDLLDNLSDGEQYWCTAGLITTTITPRNCKVLTNETAKVEEESKNKVIDEKLEVRRNKISVDETDSILKCAEDKLGDKVTKARGKNKQSFGQRLRKFFSRFSRSNN